MENRFLVGANKIDDDLVLTIWQAYDYVKLTISKGVPYLMSFEIDLADKDIDVICDLLQKAKKLRPKD